MGENLNTQKSHINLVGENHYFYKLQIKNTLQHFIVFFYDPYKN